MESNENSPGLSRSADDSRDAQKLLHDLAADRDALAGRIVAPGWLYPAFGVIAALYVASPAIDPESVRNVVVGLAIAFTVILSFGYQRISGVRMSRVGARGAVILGVLLCATLVLLSVSFGLASFDLQWWIMVPAAASFGLVLILGRWFDHQYREGLRHRR